MTRGWKRHKNLDLLSQLDEAVKQRKVRWEWISGKSESPLHKEAHALANLPAGLSARDYSKQEDEGEKLSHIDESGRPQMVDVSQKPDTAREAVAKCKVKMKLSTLVLLEKGEVPKGDVLSTAKVAGIMAAKQTPHIIPLCHPIIIGDIKIEFSLDNENGTVEITTTVKSLSKTGVEMEALTATAVTALTIYDMCKAVDRGMIIESIRLIKKSGGKSGTINLE